MTTIFGFQSMYTMMYAPGMTLLMLNSCLCTLLFPMSEACLLCSRTLTLGCHKVMELHLPSFVDASYHTVL